MFSPIAALLPTPSTSVLILSLDNYYGQGATEAARKTGLPYEELRRAGGPLGRRFYERPTSQVWFDVLRARSTIASVLQDGDFRSLVVGNDFGLIEKAAVQAAGQRKLQTILVQDGKLGPTTRLAASTMLGRIRRMLRRWGSTVLASMDLGFLGASEYGAGGADLVCAAGPAGAEILRSRIRSDSRLVITGQPRYDATARLARARSGEPRRRFLLYFTTPFGAVLQDELAQEGQEAAIRWAATVAQSDLGVPLVIKPHPQDQPDRYSKFSATLTDPRDDPVDLLFGASAAIVGPSTLVEEAAILRCPVFVPSASILGDQVAPFLPTARAYPQFDSAAGLSELMRRLANSMTRRELLTSQRREVAGGLLITTGAAKRIAALVAS